MGFGLCLLEFVNLIYGEVNPPCPGDGIVWFTIVLRVGSLGATCWLLCERVQPVVLERSSVRGVKVTLLD